jgi:DNA-binding response OmpR family regulator/tetratricopeptide (TPR) repeat protein
VPLRILIVEDDPHTRRILEALFPRDPVLAAAGVEVTALDDGEQALRALDRQAYDLIITDLVMPRMDGFELSRRVRKHENGGKTPLIVTSGIFIRPNDAAQLNALRDETGAQFFAKPFQLQELLAAVQRVLGLAAASAVPEKKTLGRVSLKLKRSAISLNSGSLEDRSVADLMLDLVGGKASGTLKLTRGQVKKEIHFSHGTPISARSNVRQETLGHFLVARGLLDEERHQQALTRAAERDERLGRSLLELGWISEDDLLRQLAAQFRARVVGALRWTSGNWTFAAGEPPSDLLPTPVDGVRLVLAGLGRTAQPDEVAHRYADSRGSLRLTGRGERCLDTVARVFGPDVSQLFRDGTHIEAVLAVPSLLPAVDALLGAGFLELVPVDSSAPEKIAVDARPESGARTLYEELFSDDISEVYGPAPPAPTAEAPARDPAADASLRKELLAAYLDLQGKDAYAVLGVGRDATGFEIDEAFSAATARFSFERFSGVDLGRDYQTLEVVQEQLRGAYKTLTSPDRRTALDAALKTPSRQPASMEADLRARESLMLLERGDYNGARSSVQRAVAAAPDQADYHALLAWCTYLADGGMEPDGGLRADALAAAMPHLEEAFWIDPDCVEAHHRAAQLALVANDENRALVHLEEVLDRAPLRQPGDHTGQLIDEALDAVKDLCARRGDYVRLERRFKKQIHRLSKDPARCVALWLDLGVLYRDRLANRDAAAEAFSTAHGLAPADPRPSAALATLRADRPSGESATSLRAAWLAAPGLGEPGIRLFQLRVATAQWDGALQAASVLVARDQADDDAKAFVRRHRPRFLARVASAMDPLVLRHPDENDALTGLFSLLLTGRLRPEPGDEPVEHAALPDAFRRVLEHSVQLFGLSPPQVVRRADLGGEVHAAPAHLVVGPDALSSDDKPDLAFRIGRALVWLGDGRAAAAAVGSRRLRALLYAAMSVARPDLNPPDPDGDIAKERARVEADPQLTERILPHIDRLLGKKDSQISLSGHLRGLARTADRAGLIACADVLVAAPALRVEGDAAALDELLDFALSDEHLSARELLGLSVAV